MEATRSADSVQPVAKKGPSLLFGLTCAAAVLLAATVLLAPLFDGGEPDAAGWGRAVALFSRDATLRRTSLASAVGLFATACVFFRPARSDDKVTR